MSVWKGDCCFTTHPFTPPHPSLPSSISIPQIILLQILAGSLYKFLLLLMKQLICWIFYSDFLLMFLLPLLIFQLLLLFLLLLCVCCCCCVCVYVVCTCAINPFLLKQSDSDCCLATILIKSLTLEFVKQTNKQTNKIIAQY